MYQKAKEFYSNMDTNFLTLTDLDFESLKVEVMGGDLISFMEIAHAILDVGGRIIDDDFIVKDDSPLESPSVEKGKSSDSFYSKPKPPKAPRSKAIRRKR